jgi:uncharacterized protein YegL
MSTLLIILAALSLWVLGGLVFFWLGGLGSRATRKRPLVRSAYPRLCLSGDNIEVKLSCSTRGMPAPERDSPIIPWDLILLIDHSGSMGSGAGSPLDEARKAAVNLVATTPDSFRFSVIEFDHEAREVCPLTDRRRGLSRALHAILPGGGTDIANGLDVATTVIAATDIDPARRRAVLLLSDGGSDGPAAIDAADRLKAHTEILLITVGLGVADMGLLRKLASSPDYCYRVDEIEQLSDLYREIGRMITGREATEAKVTESFDLHGKWALRSWGPLPPSHRALVDGEFSWLLASLREQPVEMTYQVEAICPGWRRIAPRTAKLAAKLGEDAPETYPSNAGPWILVLPYVPGWQLLSLILNPLFFAITGLIGRLIGHDLFCRHEVPPPAKPKIPPPMPVLETPPMLEPKPKDDPPLSLRPTLVLGLGFAGMHALVHCKRLLWERDWRADLTRVRFLALDTADATYCPTPRAGTVTLDDDERMTLDAPLEPIIADAATADDWTERWLPAAALLAGGARPDLHRGTGTLRPLGRLALLTMRERLRERLRPAVGALLDSSPERRVDVLIAASSGGGTGSGGVLDLAWLCRDLLREQGSADSAVTLTLIAPLAEEAMSATPEVERLRGDNHRALLTEIDRFAALRDQPQAPRAGDPPLRRWIDRVLLVAPSEQERWAAQEVLYPKAGETLFTYLASDRPDGFGAHLASLDPRQNQLTRTDGRTRLHRVIPDAHYLYPRTLVRFLAIDLLRRQLAQWLWESAPDGPELSSRARRPKSAGALLQAWLAARPEDADYPWVFLSMATLTDDTALHRALAMGAGPGISGSVSMLARAQFLDEQQTLVRGTFDAWLLDTLNRGGDAVRPHALAACLHALRELYEKLNDATTLARKLETDSNIQIVRDEAALVAELTAQAAGETESLLRRLTEWDLVLGEGTDGGGLMRHLDRHYVLLRHEIEALRDAATNRKARRSPRLPLTWADLDALSKRFFSAVPERLSSRLGWDIRRDGRNLNLVLSTSGQAEHSRGWALDELLHDGALASELAETLISLATELADGIDGWRLTDHSPPADQLYVEPPQGGRADEGIEACYLLQGALEGRFDARSHVTTIQLGPVDGHEARVIGAEQHLPSDRAARHGRDDAALPFVFDEEHHAHQAYGLYCRQNRLNEAPLPATLVGLCRDPEALLAFAFRGLAEGRLRSDDDGSGRRWHAALGAEPIPISDAVADPLDDLVRAANGWVSGEDPALREVRVPPVADPDALDRLLGSHALLNEARNDALDAWRAQLVGVVWGLVQLR